jgi:hypothetical protein
MSAYTCRRCARHGTSLGVTLCVEFKMSSPSEIEANRRNSQISRGPRTREGKPVSRLNALKSGINAKAQVIPGEDPADLEAMAEGYHQEWAPTTHLERFLVDSLIRADWLLQRLSRLEAELWTAGQVPDPPSDTPLGDTYSRNLERFTRLQRWIDSTERSYHRALKQLQRLKAPPATEGPSRILSPAESPGAEPDVLPAAELASFCHIPERARMDPPRFDTLQAIEGDPAHEHDGRV